MLIGTLGNRMEAFESVEASARTDRRPRRLGALAVAVLRRVQPPHRFNGKDARTRLRRWSAGLDKRDEELRLRPANWTVTRHARACDSPAVLQGLRALNAQLWAWAQYGGRLKWDDGYPDLYIIDPDEPAAGPTEFLNGSTITQALASTYAPPLADGSRRFRLEGPFAALLVSTLEALFSGNLGLCRSCSKLFLRSGGQTARKRCGNCEVVTTTPRVRRNGLAAIYRLRREFIRQNPQHASQKVPAASQKLPAKKKRRPNITDPVFLKQTQECYAVMAEAGQKKITEAEACEKLLKIAPRKQRGRPPQKR